MRQLISLVAVIILVLGNTTQASPINSLSGSLGVFAGSPGPFTNQTFVNGQVGILADGSIYTPGFGQITTSPFNIDLSSYSSNPGSVALAQSLNGTQSIVLTVNSAATIPGSPPNPITPTLGGQAVFTIVQPGSLDQTVAPTAGNSYLGFANLTTTLILASNTTGFDLGPVGQLWAFGATINGNLSYIPGSPGGVATIAPAGGGAGTSSASFTLTRSAIQAVPEPATIAICGIFGVAGLIGARRKLKKAKAAEPTVAA